MYQFDKVNTITIAKIGRIAKVAKSSGKPYTLVTVLDQESQKLTYLKFSEEDTWSDGWKEGDTIEAIIRNKTWTDNDGIPQTQLLIENPNKKPYSGGRKTSYNPKISAYQIAASLLPVFYKDSKKTPTLEDLDRLVEKLLERFGSPAQPQEQKTETKVPVVNVDKEEIKPEPKKVVKKVVEETTEDELEEDPF